MKSQNVSLDFPNDRLRLSVNFYKLSTFTFQARNLLRNQISFVLIFDEITPLRDVQISPVDIFVNKKTESGKTFSDPFHIQADRCSMTNSNREETRNF